MRRSWLPWFGTAIIALMGLFLAILSFLPYSILKPLTSIFTSDGNFNTLKPGNEGVFNILFGAGALFFLGLAVCTGLQRWHLINDFFKRLFADIGRFFIKVRSSKTSPFLGVALLVITATAIVIRLEFIYSSLHHDEAYTFIAFAQSLFSAITDYHLPNNHVFHSILVFLSTRVFGIQPWAVRLPAFASGVLLVPAAYWLGERIYNRWVGIGSALLVAWSPALVGYSNNARGYTLVALFTLLSMSIGDFVRKDKNLFAWGLMVLISAMGLYTVPVMLFPFGILFLWLFLENQLEGPGPYGTKWKFFQYWLSAGFSTAILTLLFYTPILIFTGPQKVFANGFVSPLLWEDLVETLLHRFAETWEEWTFGVPPVVILLGMAGWILSLIFHRKLSTTRVPLQLATFLWIGVLLIVQRPNAWSKVWVFLLPLMLIWVSAGTFGLLQKVQLKFVGNLSVAGIVSAVGILFGVWHVLWLVPQLPSLWSEQGDEENAVIFVQSQLQNNDLIVVAPPDDAPVWYYSKLHGIGDQYLDIENPFTRIWVFVDSVESQTPVTVLEKRGPDLLLVDLGSCNLREQFGKMQVYECTHEE
jgi:hypothetical protein